MTVRAVAAVIINNKKVLVAKELDENQYHTPGGTVKGNESIEDTLKRELKEELDVKLKSMKPFGNFNHKTFDGNELLLNFYLAEIDGEPKPTSEIENLSWIGMNYENDGIKVTIPMEKYVIPKLIENSLIE